MTSGGQTQFVSISTIEAGADRFALVERTRPRRALPVVAGRPEATSGMLTIPVIDQSKEVEVTVEVAYYPPRSRAAEAWQLASTGEFLAKRPLQIRSADGSNTGDVPNVMMHPSDVEYRLFGHEDNPTASSERYYIELRPSFRSGEPQITDVEDDAFAKSREPGTDGNTQEPVAVGVDHHTFVVSSITTDPTAIQQEGTHVAAGDNLLVVRTHTAFGLVNVTLVLRPNDLSPSRVVDTDPQDKGNWDHIEEVTIRNDEPLRLITLQGEVIEGVPTVPVPGTTARSFRVFLRHRPDGITEEVLIETWPSSGEPSAVREI